MATKKPAVVAKVAARAKKVAAKAAPAKKAPAKKAAAPAKKAPTKKVAEPKLKVGASAKAAATKKQEPYISVVSVELDPDNVQNGAFELDWNDIFVARLVKAGYKGRDDAQIVDQWFQDICKNVLAENFEQWEVNQPIESRIQRRDIGGGKTEVS
jgi:hypothetical protein